MRLRHAALALLWGAAAATAADVEPVGVWTFDGRNQAMARDSSPFANHGAVHGVAPRGKGLLGQAICFDGERNFVNVPKRAQLRMTNAVTVDVWVKLPDLKRKLPQCVVDKSGERYRIQIQGDRAMFGLKGQGSRADLAGGKLEPNAWHRITGVFDRPDMTLYVDGKKIATRKWDHAIDAGRTLFFGSKAGSTYFMKGWLDDVRIYNAPRPPRPDDAERFKQETAAMTQPKLEVTPTDNGLVVDTGAAQFAFDAKGHGGIRWAKVGKKQLVRDNVTPPLFGSLLESAAYDGHCDFAPDARIIDATYRVKSFKHEEQADAFAAMTEAELVWPGGDRIEARLRWSAAAGSPVVTLRLELQPQGAFANRFVRELGVQLPLALNRRKRIVQGGDQGWSFDTRCFYQFHIFTIATLLREPEHNYWRRFMVEQDSPTHFRVWRSESDTTAALTAQHGHQAPGWMAAYDEQGGVLWAYRHMSERPAKAVAANGEGGGLAQVLLHPATARAVAIDSPQAQRSLFTGEHRTDWIWFDGEFPFAQPTRLLAKAWGEKRLASDPPARPKIVELDLWNAPAASGERVPLVMGGLPLPKGAIDAPNQARVFKADREAPLQTKPLAYWPDGSIKWLLLIFPLDDDGGLRAQPGAGHGESLDFKVTLRQGQPQRFRLVYGKQVETGAVESALTATQRGDRVEIDAGALALSLSSGARWLRSVRLRGREMLRTDDSQPLSFVDFLRPGRDQTYVVNTSHAAGALDPGEVSFDSIALEEAGPLRATVRFEGYTDSKERQRVIMRIEAYAGRSFVRMFHTVEFLHKDPRVAFVRRMGVSLPLALDAGEVRVVAGAQDGPKALEPAAKTGLMQRNHLSYALWQQQPGQRFVSEVDAGQRCRGWLSVADGQAGCTAVVRNMWQEYPKEIVADGSRLTVFFWPESHPLMDVRRYSDYPHRSQGESAGESSSWVDKVYYPNDPFVGVSKTHELLLHFHDASTPAAQLDAVAADFQSQPLVYVTPEWYASLGITFPYPAPDPKRFARMDANLERVTDFWLFHQKIWAWYGMWDYGDVMHKFAGWGYGWILSPSDLAKQLKEPADKRYTTPLRNERISDYHTQTDWSFDNGRWGWGNTEGLPGLFLQLQYLRTGRRDYYFAAEAMARHVRDVDMRHDGKWFGKGTRHGVQHWSDGDHEERQTVASEWRFHHYLSGDMRSRDFLKQLTEKHYTCTPIHVHAQHSGRLYGLLTRWEMTGDPKLGDMLRRYVHCFITPDGIAISPHVVFPQVKLLSQDEVNGATMFFHTFGAMHALIEYYDLTHDEALKAALIRMADHYVAQKRRSYTFRKVVTFAAMHAANPEPYAKVLRDWTRSNAYLLFNMVSDTPKHWTGETAYLRPGVSSQWFWLGDVFYLMAWMGHEPEPSANDLAHFADMNARGRRTGIARESWQSAYDRPELRDYLTDRRAAARAKSQAR